MPKMSEVLNRLRIPFQRLGRREDDSFARVVPFDAPFDAAEPVSASFVAKPDADSPARMRDGVFVVEEGWGRDHREALDAVPAAIFLAERPRLVMARVLADVFPDASPQRGVVHATAEVDPEARIHPTVSIGAHSIVGRCEIGEGSRIGAFCIVHDRSLIGRNVVIRDHCTIGSDGFGFVRNENGALEHIPHVGRAVIEDDVEIFPYANVDRGTLGDTRIARGAKIDHYVHIGHNSTIGEDAVITAGTVTCGSSSVGARTWTGVGSIVKESTAVGSDVTIGLGAVVIKPVPDGDTVAGVPAKSLRK